ILQLREAAGEEVKGEELRIKIKEGLGKDVKIQDFKIKEVDVNGGTIGVSGDPILFKPLESKFVKISLTN
ncbi:MAG: hypothetical protein R6V75_11940, partial [Bacteroidales bacterium]